MPEISRRSLLSGSGALVATAVASVRASAFAARTFFERIKRPIGLQLYMLGPEAGLDLDATFAHVAEISYREVELPNLLGRQKAIRRAIRWSEESVRGLLLQAAVPR